MPLPSLRLTRRGLLRWAGPLALALAASRLLGWRRSPSAVQANQSGVAGRAADLISGRAVVGAVVTVVPGDQRAQTDSDGRYQMALAPGRYEVRIAARGYIGMSHTLQEVAAGQLRPVNFALIPEGLTVAEQETAQRRVLPTPSDMAPAAPLPAADLQRAVPYVNIPCWVWLYTLEERWEWVDLEEYLKGVVPAEMPAYWPMEALKAQAVAARSYAVAYNAAYGYLWANPRCQAWTPTHYATADAAVEATRGVVASHGGSIIWAFYFSRCNGQHTRPSEEALNSGDGWQTCQTGPWTSLPYCRSRPCSGHAPAPNNCGYTGHGVGMCQHGARARADEGKDYAQILSAYYTGIAVQRPMAVTLTQPADGHSARGGSPVDLRWSGSAPECQAVVLNAWGNVVAESPWLSGMAWTTNAPDTPGTYYWFVRTRNACGYGPYSELRRLVVPAPARQIFVPFVSKSSPR